MNDQGKGEEPDVIEAFIGGGYSYYSSLKWLPTLGS